MPFKKGASDGPDMVKKDMKDLDRFFHPESIAVVGASESLGSFGTRHVKSLLDFGYDKKIYPVNHNGNEVFGLKIYRSVLDIPDNVDLVSISVSARFVPSVLRECVKKGIKAAIVLSAGFRELGEEGRLLEEEIVGIAAEGIRVMGPNCFGTYSPAGGMTVIPGGSFPKDAGATALFAQSGQLSEMIALRSFGEGVRYSKTTSYGNACNINEADLLDYLVDDEETKVIAAYLEGVRDGARFLETARTNAGKKPLLIWKAGLSTAGARAAASHTASLAGGSAVWDAFFSQTGAVKIGSLEELVDTMVGFTCLPGGCGKRVAVISGGGAGAVISGDACEAVGMEMPEFGAGTIASLREVLPAVGTSIQNPLDLGNPHPSLTVLRSVLETIAASDLVDVIIIRRVFFSIKTGLFLAGAASVSLDEQEELLSIPVDVKKKFGKPVVVVMPEEITGLGDIELEVERRKVRDYFFARSIPVYTTEQRAFGALSRLASFGSLRTRANERGKEKTVAVPAAGREIARDIIASSTAGAAVLDESASKKILAAYGIDVTEPVLAQSKEAAVTASAEVGYPVVMKIASPQITHKSDVGGVRIGLQRSADVSRAYDEMMAAVAKSAPHAAIDGVTIQRMAAPGVELVVGMNRDPQFGPTLMFGLGGTLVEVLKDVAFRILPLTAEDATAVMRQIKGYRLLQGYRGRPPVDIDRLEKILLKVSAMIEDNPEIEELDINPLIAYENGAVAVDARVVARMSDARMVAAHTPAL
jgi:acetate---CoA ligase (ADP-forming)